MVGHSPLFYTLSTGFAKCCNLCLDAETAESVLHGSLRSKPCVIILNLCTHWHHTQATDEGLTPAKARTISK